MPNKGKLIMMTLALMLTRVVSASLDNGLLAHYPFNGGGFDASGNGNHASLHGGAALTQDRFGNAGSALSCDGIDDYVETGIGSNIGLHDPKTWSFVFMMQPGAASGVIIGSGHNPPYGSEAAYEELQLGMNDGRVAYYHAGTEGTVIRDAGMYARNSWFEYADGNSHYFVMTKEPGEGTTGVRVFIDNIEIPLTSFWADGANPENEFLSSTYKLCGRGPSTNDPRYTKVVLDDVRIYGRALSVGEIEELAERLSFSDFLQSCRDDILATAPDSRFTDHGDGTVTDSATGLTWKQCVEGLSGPRCGSGVAGGYTWAQALQIAAAADFAGHTDWRLPNKNELESLIERRCHAPAINSTYFSTKPEGHPTWSSSPIAGFPDGAWHVDFLGGFVDYSGKDYVNHVRLVRGGQ